jgi:hypothetical protein
VIAPDASLTAAAVVEAAPLPAAVVEAASLPAGLPVDADVLDGDAAADDGVVVALEVALGELELPHAAMAMANSATTATDGSSRFFIRNPPGVRTAADRRRPAEHMSYDV